MILEHQYMNCMTEASYLEVSVAYRNIDAVKLFIDKGVWSNTALLIASSYKDEDTLITILLNSMKYLYNNIAIDNALTNFIMNNKVRFVKFFVDNGYIMYNPVNALNIACDNSYYVIVKLLLNSFAKGQEEIAFAIACRRNDIKLLDILFEFENAIDKNKLLRLVTTPEVTQYLENRIITDRI